MVLSSEAVNKYCPLGLKLNQLMGSEWPDKDCCKLPSKSHIFACPSIDEVAMV